MYGIQEEERRKLATMSAFLFSAMFYIYILYSETFDKYYIGYSDNPERRVNEHNTKAFNTFTKKHRPWKLAYSFPVSENRADTMKIEKFIKKQKSRKFIETIVFERKSLEDFKQVLEK
jgi:putative endonuclease